MDRRDLLMRSAALTFGAAFPMLGGCASADSAPIATPAQGDIPVAFLVSDGAVVIDFCGPWEVFDNAAGHGGKAFRVYTVAETVKPVVASGGMTVLPAYDFDHAPAPKVLVIPAQDTKSPRTLEWIRAVTQHTDLTMSVCTGAFLLARTGLLDGKPATTHHDAYSAFEREFPRVELRRGARFVESGNLASAGGLTSGMDLALHVVGRYFGQDAAEREAFYLEYQGRGWLDPSSNSAYAVRRASTTTQPLCPVCDMEVDPLEASHSNYRGTMYYFCMPSHKAAFDAAPEKYLEQRTPGATI
jgi:transcriptional regulator GlxA family with amidase domain/YHS domain-containing protein